MDRRQLGNYGENIACCYLEEKGYKIIERNYIKELDSKFKGEIDIIAKKDDSISFVEVKTLKSSFQSGGFFAPENKVDFKKQKKIVKLGEIWLEENKIPLDSKWQVDAVSIKIDLLSKKARIKHFQNI